MKSIFYISEVDVYINAKFKLRNWCTNSIQKFVIMIIIFRFRFLCRALGGYILAQLPEMKGKPQVVRRRANAPSKVGQPGGNTECAKILLKLDFGQSQGKLKEYAELALNEVCARDFRFFNEKLNCF